jgi:Clusterin-associated protein-1
MRIPSAPASAHSHNCNPLRAQHVPVTLALRAVQDLARRTDDALTELSTLDKDVKLARQLIADITKAGMEIYEGLAKEGSLKEARQRAIAKQTDKSDVRQAIQVGYFKQCVAT